MKRDVKLKTKKRFRTWAWSHRRQADRV